MGWPAVIAGASFAGLAVASGIDAEVALLDRFPVGEHQTSACATFRSSLEELGATRAILRSFDSIVLHMPRPLRVQLVDPLCTFDYAALCQELLARAQAKLFLADVRGVTGHAVQTNLGPFVSPILVDATGWTSRLGSFLDPKLADVHRLTVGLETRVDLGEDDMHFFVDPRLIPWGAAWIFPVDHGCRVGVASYAGGDGVREAFERLMRLLGVLPGGVHGGAIPWALRPGTVGDIFLVGDAAGLAPPMTAEGIRIALRFGGYCGRLLDQVINGPLPLEDAVSQYRDAVRRLRLKYWLLGALQRCLGKGVDPLARALISPRIIQKTYLRLYLGKSDGGM